MEAFDAFGYLFAWIARFPHNAKFCASCGLLQHSEDPSWEGDLCRDCYRGENPFWVNFWGSHPEERNDDCWYGEFFPNKEAALACFNKDAESGVQYIEIDGPEINEVRRNPKFKETRPDYSEERSEFAMQQGMAFGCQGYNEAMGWD